MKELAFFNGIEVQHDGDLVSALVSLGLTKERIERISDIAYRDQCCQRMADSECFRPIIDYGTPEILYRDMPLPYLGKDGKAEYRRERIDYCPFCGTHTCRRIHPDTQVYLEDFNDQEEQN